MPDLKLYTIADLREWLVANNAPEGLSERIIAPARAWAILHNPYVHDSDPIVAAIFEDDRVAAYSASFPDKLDGQRIWWASTLYCDPEFTGRGYGLAVLGSLKEAHEPETTFDRWGAPETVEICHYLGLHTIYTPRYYLSQKTIDTASIRGKLASCRQSIQRLFHPWPKESSANYVLRYASCVDGEAYAFMQSHRGNNLWLREQAMLNWILRYPFSQACTLAERVATDTHFSSNVDACEYKVVKLYSNEQLAGVYLLRIKDAVVSILYLYAADDALGLVRTSIVDHLVRIHPHGFVTEDPELLAYVRKHLYFPRMHEEKVSLSVPAGYPLPDFFSLQLGDGDSFV